MRGMSLAADGLSFPCPCDSICGDAPVAQLDRARGCGPRGQRFKSSPAYHVLLRVDSLSPLVLSFSRKALSYAFVRACSPPDALWREFAWESRAVSTRGHRAHPAGTEVWAQE